MAVAVGITETIATAQPLRPSHCRSGGVAVAGFRCYMEAAGRHRVGGWEGRDRH